MVRRSGSARHRAGWGIPLIVGCLTLGWIPFLSGCSGGNSAPTQSSSSDELTQFLQENPEAATEVRTDE